MRVSKIFKNAVLLGTLGLTSSFAPHIPESPPLSREVYLISNGMTDRVNRNARGYLDAKGVNVIEELWNPFPATTIDREDPVASVTNLTMVDGVAYARTNGFFCTVGEGFMLMGASPLNLHDIAREYGFYEERLSVLFMMHEFGHVLTQRLDYSDITGINVTDSKKRSETQADFYGLLAIHYYYGRYASINDSVLLENFRTDSLSLAHKNTEAIAWLREHYLNDLTMRLRTFEDMINTSRQAYENYIETVYTPETQIESYRANHSTQHACANARTLKLGG